VNKNVTVPDGKSVNRPSSTRPSAPTVNQPSGHPFYDHSVAAAHVATLRSGLRLSYARQGDESGPAVVFLPGPTDSWRSYAPVLECLPGDVFALALSQRGHGDSDKPASGYRIEDLAHDVVQFLDAAGVDRAVLAGHSGACFVARRVALDHPDRVAGLVLEASPTTLRGDADLQEFVDSLVSELAEPIAPQFARTFVTDTSTEDLVPGFLDVLVQDVLEVPARVWHELFAELLRYDDVEELDRIAVPTLLIWGDRDPLIPRVTQEELVRLIPRAELAIYHGTRHAPRWQEPLRFGRDVAAHLRRC
jgi:pimeloyl-ACP methyl ester carboxylesterase